MLILGVLEPKNCPHGSYSVKWILMSDCEKIFVKLPRSFLSLLTSQTLKTHLPVKQILSHRSGGALGRGVPPQILQFLVYSLQSHFWSEVSCVRMKISERKCFFLVLYWWTNYSTLKNWSQEHFFILGKLYYDINIKTITRRNLAIVFF